MKTIDEHIKFYQADMNPGFAWEQKGEDNYSTAELLVSLKYEIYCYRKVIKVLRKMVPCRFVDIEDGVKYDIWSVE